MCLLANFTISIAVSRWDWNRSAGWTKIGGYACIQCVEQQDDADLVMWRVTVETAGTGFTGCLKKTWWDGVLKGVKSFVLSVCPERILRLSYWSVESENQRANPGKRGKWPLKQCLCRVDCVYVFSLCNSIVEKCAFRLIFCCIRTIFICLLNCSVCLYKYDNPPVLWQCWLGNQKGIHPLKVLPQEFPEVHCGDWTDLENVSGKQKPVLHILKSTNQFYDMEALYKHSLTGDTFETVEESDRAKEALNGADIYSGCCTLKVEWGKVRSYFAPFSLNTLLMLIISNHWFIILSFFYYVLSVMKCLITVKNMITISLLYCICYTC